MPKLKLIGGVCALIIGLGVTPFGIGCAGDPPVDLPASYIRVHIDKSDPERLLAYYFGSYVAPEPADPFEAGLVEKVGRRFYANIDSLEKHYPGAAAHLVDADDNDRIDWDEFEAFIESTYYLARAVPTTVEELHSAVSFDTTDADWMRVDVDGVMSTARRAIYIRESTIAEALSEYWANEEQILYPFGTAIIGEHILDGRRAETTAMIKRTDGFWDFIVYGSNDSLASATSTPPKELRSPVQCVGCHFGNKLFEPERSFPAMAEPGPHGPRRLYVAESLRNERLVRFFDEHRKRSDTILGLYSTLFVAKLQSMSRRGELTDERQALLESLKLPS